MRVKMRSTISGSRNGVVWPSRGEIVDLPVGEAADLVRCGLAVEHTGAPGEAEAVVEPAPVKRKPGRPRKAATDAQR